MRTVVLMLLYYDAVFHSNLSLDMNLSNGYKLCLRLEQGRQDYNHHG